ncbi:fibrous sheath CABYR-binding protein isoform X2 [Xiphias gladius]|uniref:fibrous sheath CABYR-binding protein isoform X2 n=1 Tax=Xiphias gladius TaxID=8245 RepID=UPI001A97E002|nr:fibrous sheath CABYR-binding protein isoform X2 [Xiphias gladius]
MAAALFRGGTGLYVRCIRRELCRVVWRPQAALFSSKPTDRKLPRRTHIKKAKPQPAIDVAKLLEQLFSQRRPSTAPPAAAQPAKASSMPTEPPTTSSMKVSTSDVPRLSKTEPAVPVFPAESSVSKKTASTFTTPLLSPQPESASSKNPKTSFSSETSQQSPLGFIQVSTADGVSTVTVPTTSISPSTSTAPASSGSEAATAECQTSAEKRETKVETATEADELTAAPVLPLSALVVEKNVEKSSVPGATVEPLIKSTAEPSAEASLPPVDALETRASVVEGPVDTMIDATVDTAAREVQTKDTDSGEVDTSYTTTVEPLIETAIEPSAETSITPLETLDSMAVVAEGTVEPTIEAEAHIEGVVHVSYGAKDELLVDTRINLPAEAGLPPVEALETRASVEGTVESAVDATVDAPTEEVPAKGTDLGGVNISRTTTIEPLLEIKIETSASVAEGAVESTIEAVADTATQANSTDSAAVNIPHAATVEPLLECTVEPSVEAITSPLESPAAVVVGTVELSIESQGADNLSFTALIRKAHESPVLPSQNQEESTVESPSGNVAVEEGVKESEKMTLESVTLSSVQALLESLKTDELLQTKFVLDEKAEGRLQELIVQTGPGAEHKAAAEAENPSEDEREILTEVLSKWESLSEDLQELEGETGTLVKELLCHVPAVLSETPGTVKTSSVSDQPVGVNGESLQMEEKATEEEAMTLESITLVEVKAKFGSLETEVLQETSSALQREADVLAKEEKMEGRTATEDVVFEDTTEAEILTLDAISEATDAIEAETSVMLEAMFGSEQGPRQPSDTLLLKLVPQNQMIGQEAEKESGEQEGSVLEAMSLESVTLAEVEASLGTLENESLSETTTYLESEAEIFAGERRVEVEEATASEEITEALHVESLFLPEADGLPEDLQTDALMEELLFTVPGHVGGATGAQIGQEVVRANILDATVATGSAAVDTAAAETGDYPASPAPKEVLLGQETVEEGAQTEEGTGTRADLDPVQRLFLEKIREYNNIHRLSGGPVEAEPDYGRRLAEETAKLRRLYGGGDLGSFPQFTFTEPKVDPDSK